MRLFLTASVIVLALSNASAFAADEKKPANQTETPVSEWMDAENAMIDGLKKKQKETVFILRNKHGVIRSVRVVDRDVGNAVKACGKENPEIRKDMDTRFKDWQNAVLPILDTAQDFLDKEIDSQKTVDAKELRSVLKLNDAAYAFGESKIEKMPVTEKEACRDLLKSMDRTEDQLITLLQDMLLPENVIRERAERASKDQE